MKKSLFLAVILSFPGLAAAEEIPVQRYDMTPRERIETMSVRTGLAERTKDYPPRLETPFDGAIADPSLSQGILKAIQTDPELSERPLKLKVSVVNGAVRLEGVVNDAAERRLVVERAKAAAGVRRIDDRLRVKKSDRDLLED